MKYFNFFAAIFLSILYVTGKIPPSEKFNIWITIFIIPFAMVANTILLVTALILRKKSGLYYLVPMLIGLPYVVSTFGIKGLFHREIKHREQFTVFNYNMARFSIKGGEFANTDSAVIELRNLILNPFTDIQCYQEFVTLPWHKRLNVIRELERRKMNYYFSMEGETGHSEYSTAGILIVSKFPIVHRGELLSSNNGFNRVAYADVKIGSDTVRIINAHLESMGLSKYDPRLEKNIAGVRHNTRTIISKLKSGVFERSKQVKQIASFVADCPYPVICVGDFNDMPYSYSYQYLKWRMKNSFEESGTGFGFTYNGGTLRTLRIDNQFYLGNIRSTDLVTRYDIRFTDHFPVQGTYVIPDSQ